MSSRRSGSDDLRRQECRPDSAQAETLFRLDLNLPDRVGADTVAGEMEYGLSMPGLGESMASGRCGPKLRKLG